jgi:DNA replication and repair protein RecF
MRIKSLKIEGFRNLKKTSLEFNDEASIFAFTGPNGHGKTNLLEAIFLLSISKSFRSNENLDLVGFDEEYCTLSAEVERGEDTLNLDLIVTKNPPKKTLKINGVQKNAADYIGNFNVVFFSPDDIGMIHLAPSVRRKYLDLLLSQLDRDYLEDSLKYQQAIKQRNALLKQIADGKASDQELDFWDQQLAQLGVRIMEKRTQIVEELNAYASEFYSNVSENKDKLKIKYQPSVEKEGIEGFLESLLKGRKRDIINGATQVGPHRDDLNFLCNDRDMKSFASRGEWRSLVLTLKFAEIDLLKSKKGFYPILLLDDVFSELDESRQKILFNKLKNTQTFITTTHEEFLGIIEGDFKKYSVIDGVISM